MYPSDLIGPCGMSAAIRSNRNAAEEVGLAAAGWPGNYDHPGSVHFEPGRMSGGVSFLTRRPWESISPWC